MRRDFERGATWVKQGWQAVRNATCNAQISRAKRSWANVALVKSAWIYNAPTGLLVDNAGFKGDSKEISREIGRSRQHGNVSYDARQNPLVSRYFRQGSVRALSRYPALSARTLGTCTGDAKEGRTTWLRRNSEKRSPFALLSPSTRHNTIMGREVMGSYNCGSRAQRERERERGEERDAQNL